MKSLLRHSAIALAFAGLVPSAQALSINFTDVSTNGGMSAQQLSAFNAAADYWESKLSDNVTLNINIAFNSLGANILGSTNSQFVVTSYTNIVAALTADATSALDATAVSHLQPGSAMAFQATQGDLSSRFDNDGSANNTSVGLTTANAKAMGFSISPSVVDATITFSTGFANSFSYSRAGGTPFDKLDFITVAEHEIGHALGFTSGVDDIDYYAGSVPQNAFEDDWWVEPLDLFRYTSAGVMSMEVGGSPYLSVDGGVTTLASFSTGVSHGDGWQASHFGPNQGNLMRAFVSNGENYDATVRDLAAFDAIGWDLTTAVPEPTSAALMGAGLMAFLARRRPKAKAA